MSGSSIDTLLHIRLVGTLAPPIAPDHAHFHSSGYAFSMSAAISAMWRLMTVAALLALGWRGFAAAGPELEPGEAFYKAGLIFPLESLHNHASCVVECPDGSLLACWYRGSGERKADDVVIMGARLPSAAGRWSTPFLMADTPGYPDANPVMVVDPYGRLWLMWVTVLANEWHTALLKYRTSSDWAGAGAPHWETFEVLHITPGQAFAATVQREFGRMEPAASPRTAADPGSIEWLERGRRLAEDKFFQRLGWMPRAHPVILDGQRLIVPLYSDGYDFSLMAISDDWGGHWVASEPLVSAGGVQPSLVRRRDGRLVALMRDNGPPPQRVLSSESRDRGETWSPVVDSDLPDPGAGLEVIELQSGAWLLINNDTEKGRHQLTAALSFDEGATWPVRRHLERAEPQDSGAFHYPSVIQSRDGTIHVTYSYFVTSPTEGAETARAKPELKKSIKHAHFNEAWVKSR